jgi:TP901 family phage tail tape measure protein
MAIQIPLNAQLQNATQLQQQIQNAVNSVQLNLGGSGGSRALNSLSQPLGRLTGQADEFTKSLDAANARVLAFGASVGVLNTITNAFKAMVDVTITVEKTLADINVVFGKSSSEIKDFGKGIFDVAKQTGQSFQEVSKAALEFSRQGLTLEDTLARTKDALVLTRLTGLDTANAVQGLTATINSFSKEALTSSEIINKLASVDQKFSVSAADLTEALSRSASVAQNAGVNFDELIGIITSLQERTARGGAVIGNSIKTIFTRIQRPEVLADLQNLGVAVKDIKTDKLLSASEILKNLAGNIGALGQIQKSGIFEEVAGGFQINQLQALLTDLAGAQSTASKAQQVSTNATNEAYTANERLNQTISALINNSVEGLKELGATLGDLGIADSIKTALGAVNGFIESVQNLMEGEGAGAKLAQGIVKGIGSVLSGPGLVLFGVVITKLIYDLGKFAIQGLKTFLGIGKAASEQKALQEAIVITLSRNASLQAQIGKFQGNAVAQASILAGIYNQQEASLKRQAATAQGMASVLYSQGMRAGPKGFTQTGRAAGGYLPSAEAADVSRGVGGASPSSQVVSIPNFAFGNGQRGTMIANTSEYIVPNYANGGSAIFNQDMVSSMGLPAGAQKIRAAGGYIPNFAKPLVIDAQKDLGGIGMITIGGDPNEKGNAAYRFSYQRAGISANKINNLKNTSYAKDSSPVHVVNMIGSKGLTALGEGSDETKRSAFSSKLNSKIVPSIVSLSRDLFQDYFEVPNLTPITSKPVLSPSVEGTIFQEVVAIAADAFRKDGQSTAFQGEDNRPFNYNPQEPADPRLQKLFFDDFDVLKADAKRADNNESRESMVKKIFNDSYIFKKLLNNRPDIKNEIGENITLNAGSKRSQSITKSAFLEKNAAKGYIPNFANQALTDSINREKIQSGLPMSAISVTQDSRLINSRNPTGLAVINSRDEPNGRIPNFAAPKPLTATDFNPVAFQALGTSLADLNKKIIDLTSSVSKGAKTQDQADDELKKFINTLPNKSSGGILNTSTPGSGQTIYNKASSTLRDATSDNAAKVAKGFGDAAGKIFLFQTALSFATGAMGDVDSAAGKLAGKIAETTTNITSLAIFGKELAGMDAKGALAKFGKSLGVLGVGIGIAHEGFKLADYAIKEYTGENKKAADATALLADASAKAAGFLSELSQATQNQIANQTDKTLASAGFQSWFNDITTSLGMTDAKAGGDIGGNPEIVSELKKLYAVGASQSSIEAMLAESKTKDIIKTPGGFIPGSNQRLPDTESIKYTVNASTVMAKGAAMFSDLTAKMVSFKEGLTKINFSEMGFKDQVESLKQSIYGKTDDTIQSRVLDDLVAKQKLLNFEKNKQLDTDKAIYFGENISAENVKAQVNSIIELRKLQTERLTEEEASLNYQLAMSPLTALETVELQRQLELVKLRKSTRQQEFDAVQKAVDVLNATPGLQLGLKAEEVDIIVSSLQKIDPTDAVELSHAIQEIAAQYDVTPAQVEDLNKGLKIQLGIIKKITDEKEKEINLNAKEKGRTVVSKGTFDQGMTKGLIALKQQTVDFQYTIGEEIPRLFSSNLAQGLNDAISGAKSLKEALTDAATSFFRAITQKNIENLANMFTVGVGGIGKANGGMINGGSGVKDDVPAMLMGGEYVIKKSAVKKYGSNFLDSLNQGRLSGYATGGAVQSGRGGFYTPGEYGQGAITGKRQLLDFATQDLTSGQFDQMGSYGMTGASINLEAESSRLTMAGRENSPIFERTQQAKEEAFQVYLQSLQVDKQYQEQLKQMEEAEKARKKQLTTAIVSAVASSALSYGASAFGTGAENAVAEAGAKAGAGAPLKFWDRIGTGLSGGLKNLGAALLGGAKPTFQLNDFAQARRLKMPVSNFRAMQSSKGVQGYTPYLPSNTFSGGVLNIGGNSNNGGNELLPNADYVQKDLFAEIDKRYRANGGPIFGGSGMRDDVPAMLTGGEFVLNNRATRKLGMSNLQRLNSGDTSSQQSSAESSSDLTQALMSKLDELINETKKTSKDNIVVNVSGMDNKGEKNDGTESASQKDLQKKIKAAVLEVITQEKRLGGSLNK